jgi:hypothetical protein
MLLWECMLCPKKHGRRVINGNYASTLFELHVIFLVCVVLLDIQTNDKDICNGLILIPTPK